MQQLYGDDDSDIPVEVLVTELPEAAVATWLTDKSGRRVQVRIPQRGRKRALLETVTNNAEADLAGTQAAACRRPECPGCRPGGDRRGSGDEPSPTAHRVWISRICKAATSSHPWSSSRTDCRANPTTGVSPSGVAGQDDVASVAEVVRRRFTRYLAERAEATDIEFGPSGTANDERKAFRYPPQLLLIDGGKPQVAAAEQALRDLGIDDLAVAGWQKARGSVGPWPGRSGDPLPAKPGLYLLQRIRDEAHRFAITYHRQKRSRRLSTSVVEDIPGSVPTGVRR